MVNGEWELDIILKKSSESVVYRVSKNILKIVNEGVKLCVGLR